MNKLVNIKQPVLEAIQDMGIDHGKNIEDFTRWASRAEFEIGSYYSYRKKIVVKTIDRHRAELPCETQFVQRVLLGDYSNASVVDLMNISTRFARVLRATNNGSFLVVDVPDTEQLQAITPIRWEVQNNHIILADNLDKQKLTIQYLGLEVDADGFPLVSENHIEAIVEYIMYRYAKRSRFTPIKMDLADVDRFYKNWNNLCADARAKDAEISEADRGKIVEMIHDPLSGYGLQLQPADNIDYRHSFYF